MLETTRVGEVTRFKMATILGGRPAYWVAAYLVDGLLVDTGCANTASELLAALEAEASAGHPVRTVVNTHYHEDHVGANRLVRERFGARILAHPRAVPLIARPGAIPDYRVLVWGRPEGAMAEPAGDAIATARYHFLVVDTPGHCRGHLSLIEPERGWCFTGDLFVGEQPRVAWRETNVADMIASLERLASPLAWSRGAASSRSSLGPGEGRLTLFTAPGEVVPDGRRGLRSCAQYLRRAVDRARELRVLGLSEEAVRDSLFRGESSFAALTQGEFSALNLTRALLDAAPGRP